MGPDRTQPHIGPSPAFFEDAKTINPLERGYLLTNSRARLTYYSKKTNIGIRMRARLVMATRHGRYPKLASSETDKGRYPRLVDSMGIVS